MKNHMPYKVVYNNFISNKFSLYCKIEGRLTQGKLTSAKIRRHIRLPTHPVALEELIGKIRMLVCFVYSLSSL